MRKLSLAAFIISSTVLFGSATAMADGHSGGSARGGSAAAPSVIHGEGSTAGSGSSALTAKNSDTRTTRKSNPRPTPSRGVVEGGWIHHATVDRFTKVFKVNAWQIRTNRAWASQYKLPRKARVKSPQAQAGFGHLAALVNYEIPGRGLKPTRSYSQLIVWTSKGNRKLTKRLPSSTISAIGPQHVAIRDGSGTTCLRSLTDGSTTRCFDRQVTAIQFIDKGSVAVTLSTSPWGVIQVQSIDGDVKWEQASRAFNLYSVIEALPSVVVLKYASTGGTVAQFRSPTDGTLLQEFSIGTALDSVIEGPRGTVGVNFETGGMFGVPYRAWSYVWEASTNEWVWNSPDGVNAFVAGICGRTLVARTMGQGDLTFVALPTGEQIKTVSQRFVACAGSKKYLIDAVSKYRYVRVPKG